MSTFRQKNKRPGKSSEKKVLDEAIVSSSNRTTSNSSGNNIDLGLNVIERLKTDRKKLNRTRNNGGGSGSGSGSGNNSDNSALVSIGNDSFGFNFDSEDASEQNDSDNGESKNNTGHKSSSQKGEAQEETPGNTSLYIRKQKPLNETHNSNGTIVTDDAIQSQKQITCSEYNGSSSVKPSLESSRSINTTEKISDNEKTFKTSGEAAAAAAAAVEKLRFVVKRSSAKWKSAPEPNRTARLLCDMTVAISKQSQQKNRNHSASRKRDNREEDSDVGGYNTDDEGWDNNSNSSHRGAAQATHTSSAHQESQKKKSKKIDEHKREERNAREKERSFRISRQINDLRALLSTGGVIVPKGTKSSVLTEAANYIRMLQQHQYRSEIDRHQLIQQMQMIGSGGLGPQAAGAIRHVAAQNGVWSLGNFGGVPPRSAMSAYQPGGTQKPSSGDQQVDLPTGGVMRNETPSHEVIITREVQDHEYRSVFNTCAVGMAIASLGGAFIDCNKLFCDLSEFTKQEVCSMTIFNLTSRSDLQHAFDLISQMISPPNNQEQRTNPCILRGSMKEREDLGLSIALIKGENDGIAKCFCITLVNNSLPPSSLRAMPATPSAIQQDSSRQNTSENAAMPPKLEGDMQSPAFTTTG